MVPLLHLQRVSPFMKTKSQLRTRLGIATGGTRAQSGTNRATFPPRSLVARPRSLLGASWLGPAVDPSPENRPEVPGQCAWQDWHCSHSPGANGAEPGRGDSAPGPGAALPRSQPGRGSDPRRARSAAPAALTVSPIPPLVSAPFPPFWPPAVRAGVGAGVAPPLGPHRPLRMDPRPRPRGSGRVRPCPALPCPTLLLLLVFVHLCARSCCKRYRNITKLS